MANNIISFDVEDRLFSGKRRYFNRNILKISGL